MNRRTWQVSLLFALSSLVMFAAMGWITALAWRLDRQEAEAQRRAELEENTRLALWRMDSVLAPVVAQESVRPYPHFTAYFPVAAAYQPSLEPIDDGRIFAPSPLVAFHSPIIRLHFQLDSQGVVTSPQAPTDSAIVKALRDRFGNGVISPAAPAALKQCQQFAESQQLMQLATAVCGDNFQEIARPSDNSQRLPLMVCTPLTQITIPEGPGMPPLAANNENPPPPLEMALKQSGRARIDVTQQDLRNNAEFVQRQKTFDNSNKNLQSSNPYYSLKSQPDMNAAEDRFAGLLAWGTVEVTPFAFAWVNDELVYLRRVRLGKVELLQGCWFDWLAIHRALLDEIRDLLPAAMLRPMREHRSHQQRFATRTLASMPIQLISGELPPGSESLSPLIRHSLWVAWACVTLAVVAVGVLLRGSVLLGERRADFVSAVTHELRTPLTTFRLYLDLLVGGRIRDEAQRDEYLVTLQGESERLGHLVENVLSYARLERGRRPGNRELWEIGALVGRFSERLQRRAEQGEMTLQVEVARDAARQALRTDPTAVEQIVFNLVDNACKYASVANDRRIELEVAIVGADVEFRVTDHGPGLSDEAQGRLFRPFSKSAHRAANTAPGVGLGLALSRRLARDLGGDLRHGPSLVGSRFVLRLPCLPAE